MLLPVDLLYFDVKPAGTDEVLLTWATATETNNLGFEIQRANGMNSFEKIGWVPGYGNSNTLRTYTFSDNHVRSNTTYHYRLKQMDSNGVSKIHDVKSVTLSNSYAEFGEFYPNPAEGTFWLQVNVLQATQLSINFYNADGKKQADFNFNLKKGSNRLEIPAKSWESGIYVGQVIFGEKVFFKRIAIS